MSIARRWIPLERCVARPPEGGRAQPLIDHLLEVARRAGNPRGSVDDQLLYLAGLLHDVGKARRTWQERLLDPRRKGPVGPHAFVGAALFAALVFQWNRNSSGGQGVLPPNRTPAAPVGGRPFGRFQASQASQTSTGGGGDPAAPPALPVERLLAVTRDIADHHGTLADLETDTPWQALWTPDVLSEMDMEGLIRLVRATDLPVAAGLWPRDGAEWGRWVADARGVWGRAVIRLQRRKQVARVDARELLRHQTARLIQADRFAVAGIEPETLDPDQAALAIRRMKASLAASLQPNVTAAPAGGIGGERQRLQRAVLEGFRKRPDAPIYVLVLPTGSGKTLTAMRVALEACLTGGRKRIVYVGPYLTVVEQAAAQFQRHTGLPAMQHHHLATPDTQVTAHDRGTDPVPTDDDLAFLLLESWQAPVVAVTFHQFFRALFPRRAQHTLRIPALRDAFVIFDEPQIMDPGSWWILGEMMVAACEAWNMQVLIMTATMPPWAPQHVLPVDLSVPVRLPSRYVLRVVDHEQEGDGQGWGPEALARRLVHDALAGFRVAAILNTIADAQSVYEAVRELLAGVRDGSSPMRDRKVLLVHGLMAPAHKARQVHAIGHSLQADADPRHKGDVVAPIVVATQTLEAGVDLDFDRLYRARPVMPSVVQAAGRANRHGQREPAQVVVFDFMRSDGKDSRPWIYRDPIARDETDRLLVPGQVWQERQLDRAVEEYYRRWWERKPGSDARGPLAEAAAGAWSVLGGLMPFDEGPTRVPVFVPRDDLLTRDDREVLATWHVGTLHELYTLYARPDWLGSRSQGERRRFLGLLERYVVPVPFTLARQVAEVHPGRRILRLVDLDAYDLETGFGGWRQMVAAEGGVEGGGVDIW